MNCQKCGHPVTFTERDGQWLAQCMQRFAKVHQRMLLVGTGETREQAYAHLCSLIDDFFARREARKKRIEKQLNGAPSERVENRRGPRTMVPVEIEEKCPSCHVKLKSGKNTRAGVEWVNVWCPNGPAMTCEHRSFPTRANSLEDAVARWLEAPQTALRKCARAGQSKYDREAPKCPRCGLRMFEGDTHECIGKLSEYARTGEDASGNWATWV